MSSELDSNSADFQRRKYDANSVLSEIYRQAHPQIHLRTGYTSEEWPAAIAKVNRGLELLINLCDFELSQVASTDEQLRARHLLDLNETQQPVFAEGTSLGYEVCNDAAWLIDLMFRTEVYEDYEYDDILAPLYEFFKICLATNTGAGDMYLRICSVLEKGVLIDESYELQITKDIIKAKLNNDQITQRWLMGILNSLSDNLAKERSENELIAVERFYDNDYIVAYATDDFVTFDELDLHRTNKSRYNDDYVHGQVYRNDKIFPDNPQDWLNIVVPDNPDALLLGTRFYISIDEAKESEQRFMNYIQALLDD